LATSPTSNIMSEIQDNPQDFPSQAHTIANHHDDMGASNNATISSCSSNNTGLTDDSALLFSNALDEFDFSGLDEDYLSCTSLIFNYDSLDAIKSFQ